MWALISTIALWLFFMLIFLFLPVVMHVLGKSLHWLKLAMDAWNGINERIIDWMDKEHVS